MALAEKTLSERLRGWRAGSSHELRSVVRRGLEDACAVFDVDRGLIAFEESEEPFITLASLHDGHFSWRDESCEAYTPLVDMALADGVFFVSKDRTVIAPSLKAPGSEAIHPRIVDEIGPRSMLSIPLHSDSFVGRVFLAVRSIDAPDLWACAEAVGRLISVSMEAAAAARTAVGDAIADERLRVGRDLHDGVLQSFTGVVLQLETIHSLMESQPEEAQRLITQAQGMIMSDQRELRTFVETLRPRARPQIAFDLDAALTEMARRFEKQWGVHIAVEIDRLDPLVGKSLGNETYRLILEAVTNSAKHGAATAVDVRLKAGGGRMTIEVTDNGTGFAFHGRMTLSEIRSSGHGPSTLAERVASLNGELTVVSSENGATIEISVPLGFDG